MSGVKIDPSKLASFDSSVQGWFSAVRKAAEEAAVGLAHEAFEQILETSPQYSGDFVANTKVGVGAPDPTFEEGAGGGTAAAPLGMGSPGPMNYARAHAQWPTIKLGQKVFISSTAKHDELYAWKIEDGQIKLRPINEGAAHIYTRAQRYVASRYSRLGPVQLSALRKTQL